MVVVRLLGGFASQLGKYAWTKKLADTYQTELQIDISEYTGGYFRPFMMHYLNLPDCDVINHIEKTENVLYISDGQQLLDHIGQITDHVLYICNEEQDYEVFFEKYPQFRISEDWNIFQTMILRKKSEFVDRFQEQIKGEYSVAVHVRRGDFVNLGWSDNIDEYRSVIGYILKNNPNAKFYFFSNDIQWVEEAFGGKTGFTFVRNQNGFIGDIEEFICMSLCNMRILSSLSGYSKYANYLSYHVCEKSEGAYVINKAKQGEGITHESIEDRTLRQISDEESQQGSRFFETKVLKNVSSIEEFSTAEQKVSQNNCSDYLKKIVIVTNEIFDKWKYQGAFMIAKLLAEAGNKVLYVNVNAYNQNHLNEFQMAQNADNVPLGFEQIFISDHVGKTVCKINDWIAEDGEKALLLTSNWGKKKSIKYGFSFFLMRILRRIEKIKDIDMTRCNHKNYYIHNKLSELDDEKVTTFFEEIYYSTVKEIEKNEY